MEKYLVSPRIFLPALAVLAVFLSVNTVFDSETNKTEEMSMQEETIDLPEPRLESPVSLEETIERRRSVRSYQDEPLNLEQVSQLLWSAQGITLESRGYRAAPSAGATFPLEVCLVAGEVENLPAGVYKYVPDDHTMVAKTQGDIRGELADACLGQESVRNAPVSLVIAADYERTASQYGDRAKRYVHMEIGHVGQNVSLQAITMGLGSVMIGAFTDEQLKDLMPVPDNEDPLYVIPVGKE